MTTLNFNVLPWVNLVRRNFAPDQLKDPKAYAGKGSPAGYCYVASEALYHLLGGKARGWKAMRAPTGNGDQHWWLQHESGIVLDATYDQFMYPFDYSKGIGTGFLTKGPCKRTKRLLNRMYGAIK